MSRGRGVLLNPIGASAWILTSTYSLILNAYILQTSGTTYQTGQDTVVRGQFIQSGVLANTEDVKFRAISDNWPVFAFAHNLGTVSVATDPVIFTVGHVRDPAVQYIVTGGALQDRSVYFQSQFSSVADAVSILRVVSPRGCFL